MLKYIGGLIVLILIAVSGWYFFLKAEDYKISFNSKFQAEHLYLSARQGAFEELKLEENSNEEAFKELTQIYSSSQGRIKMKWDFSEENSESTGVNLKIIHQQNNFLKRLKIIFFQPEFQREIVEALDNFRKKLEAQDEVFKIKIQGKGFIPDSNCACVNLNARKDEKAFEMMKSIDLLSDFVAVYELETAGRPRVVINKYNEGTEVINFDFCFPLQENSKIPDHPLIFQRNITAKPGLKAIFNGNYMHSHHAWPYLVTYAESQAMEIEYLPLEVYNSNPEMGGDALKWEAEIYLPILN